MIHDFLPQDAKPNERAVLIVYHCLRIKNPQDIAIILNRDVSFVYKILRKYSGKIYQYSAPVPRFVGSGISVSGQ